MTVKTPFMEVPMEKAEAVVVLQEMAVATASFLQVCVRARRASLKRRNLRQSRESRKYNMISRIPAQVAHLQKMINISDADCIENLKMSRNAFSKLCYLLENRGGLSDSRHVRVHEKVAMFLSVLGHHRKNRIVRQDFVRSGHTVSKCFHEVLQTIFKVYPILLATPEPVPEDCSTEEWKWFKGCLGALDCAFINVKVPDADKVRYRSRKGEIAVNILGACNRDMKFIYVLAGWEGSAADNRVLLDALNREHGLKVPDGNYYLCDNAFAIGKGILTPYRNVRSHLLHETGDASSSATPQNKEELFNLKHLCARRVIHKAFKLLKMRWEVLKGPSYYSIKVQNRIIMACALLHNFVRTEMPEDPLEQNVEENMESSEDGDMNYASESQVWSSWRDDVANSMFNEWQGAQ